MLNSVIIQGRLVYDPEIRVTKNGTSVLNVRLAVNRDFSEECDFLDIIIWEKSAEFVTEYFAKGDTLLIQGRIQQHQWKDDDGNIHNAVEIVADRVHFPGGKAKANQEAEKPQKPASKGRYKR